MTDTPLGRACPDCGEPMSNMPSLNARQCTNGRCQLLADWHLAPGQQPLINPSRADRRPQQ
jgi:endogenous inhibitor of DNA gyrase (YacG/DUF329 family)